MCISDKFLPKGVCKKSSSNDVSWFIGVLRFLGICFCECVTLTWCKVDGLLVSAAYFFAAITFTRRFEEI